MPRTPILVADARHFGARKFPPLYDFAAKSGIRIRTEKSRAAWWERANGYRGLADRLAPHRRILQDVPPTGLMAHRYRDIDVFACARSELARLLLPRSAAEPWPADDGEVIGRAFACAEQREDMLLCLAAVRNWIDFWQQVFDRTGPYCCAIAHRGNAIHSRSLIEVATRRGIRTFVTDRLSAGRHFFFEERAMPIASRPLLGDPDWYAQLALPSDPGEREPLRAEAHCRLAPIRAAVNARPPAEDLAPRFGEPMGGIVLVLGQPIGEPSLLEAPRSELASPAIYRRLIAGLLDRTDLPVVFRIDGPPIARLLGAWRDTLPTKDQARFWIVESAPLDILLMQARLVVSLAAPLTLAACRAGLKPVQFGRAVLAGKGFTQDFNDPNEFLDDLAIGRIDFCLSLDEYRSFEDFLVRLLLLHLVPIGHEGVAKIAARLSHAHHLPSWRDCDLSMAPRSSPWRSVTNAIANPAAALRLART